MSLQIGSEMTSPISLPGNVTSRTGTISSGGQQTSSNLTDKEAVLSSFFNSLLTRKNLSNESTPTSPAPPSTSGLGNGNTSEQRQISGATKKISLISSRAAQEPVGLAATEGDKGKSLKSDLPPSRTISEPGASDGTQEQQNRLVVIEKQKQDMSAVKERAVERKTDATAKNSPSNSAVKSAGEMKSAELNAITMNDTKVSGSAIKKKNDNPPEDKKPGHSKDPSVQLESIDKPGNQENSISHGEIQNVTAKPQKKPIPKSTVNSSPGSQPVTFEIMPSGSRTSEGNQSSQESTNQSSSNSNSNSESIMKTQRKSIINNLQKPKLASTVAEEQQKKSAKSSRPEIKPKEPSITAQKLVKQTELAKTAKEEPNRPGQKESIDKGTEE